MASLLTTVLPMSVGVGVLAVGGWLLYRTLRCDQSAIPPKSSPEQQSLLTSTGPGRASYSALGGMEQRYAQLNSAAYTSSGVLSDATGAEPCSLGLQTGDRVVSQLYVADEFTSSPEAISQSFLQQLQHHTRNSAEDTYLSLPTGLEEPTTACGTVPITRASPMASGASGLSIADLPLADSNASVVVLVADSDRYSPSCSPQPSSMARFNTLNAFSSTPSCNVTTVNTPNKIPSPATPTADAPGSVPTHRPTESEAFPGQITTTVPSPSRRVQNTNGHIVSNTSTTSASPREAVPLKDPPSYLTVDVTTTSYQGLPIISDSYPEKPPS
ncbi:hypothetical protein IWQ61_005330, partial [Dispira simplex]